MATCGYELLGASIPLWVAGAEQRGGERVGEVGERPEPGGPVMSHACVITASTESVIVDAAAAASTIAIASAWPASSSHTVMGSVYVEPRSLRWFLRLSKGSKRPPPRSVPSRASGTEH